MLTTGGLGPTRDDISKRVVAELFGAPLEFDDEVWAALVERFARLGRVPVASNRSQAEVPRGATVLPNRWGTAPGLWLEGAPGLVIMLPGVPGEMRKLLEHEVVPRGWPGAPAAGSIRSRLVRTTGIAGVDARRADGRDRARDRAAHAWRICRASTASISGSAPGGCRPDEADARLAAAAALLRERGGEHVYGEGEADLAALVLEAAARRAGGGIATAESCTGGLVGARLTEIPGSSDVYVRRRRLPTPTSSRPGCWAWIPALMAAHGAVSEPVALRHGRAARPSGWARTRPSR